MPLLTCEGLTLGYEGRRVVEGLAFTVAQNDYLCVAGENGSGKSTLIKCILRLVPPMEGRILMGEGMRQNEIGYLPQQAQVQRDFPASVREVVLSGCLNRCGMRPFFSREERRLAESCMERVNISALGRESYRALSGGQRQRVLLARALCATRRLLLLDEPAAGLDPLAAGDLYETIDDLNKQHGVTIIMITHDIAASLAHASHVLHLGAHRSLFFGTKDDYLKSGSGHLFGRLPGGAHDERPV